MAWGASTLFSMQVDADLKVWLLEVNSSPAVAEDLLQQMFSKDASRRPSAEQVLKHRCRRGESPRHGNCLVI